MTWTTNERGKFQFFYNMLSIWKLIWLPCASSERVINRRLFYTHGLKSKGFYKHVVATCLRLPNINRMIFLLQFEVGYPLPTEHVQFLMERNLHGLTHSPFPSIDVMITLRIFDAATQLNGVFFRIFLDYVLPEEIQDYCSIFIVYHQTTVMTM